MGTQLGIAFILSSFIATGAYWRRSLAASGALTALLIGTLTFGFGGWLWGVLLGVFFVSSSALSHFREAEKLASATEKFDKGHRRDWGQVLANGGAGALMALASAIWPSPFWFYAFVGVMATVTADTWATELGTLSRQPPHLITTGRRVEVGTSGGVSPLGTAVSLAGGILIGLTAGILGPLAGQSNLLPATISGAVGGLVGSLFDSLLGATVQHIYYCDVCQKETEKRLHKCGRDTRPLRGWFWLNNDLVNLISSLVGGGTAVLLWTLIK